MIGVFGLGFVGLTTALGLCHAGHRVIGFDADNDLQSTIAGGRIPFHEPNLADALRTHLGTGFRLADTAAQVTAEAEVFFVCVGTPEARGGGTDMNALFAVVDRILDNLHRPSFKVLVIKSTVPPSTTRDRIIPHLIAQGWTPGKDIGVVCNPEFLREGHAWQDFTTPDRIVLGTTDQRSQSALTALYAPFERPVHCVSYTTAELIKYLSNTLLATLISFSNEWAMIADRLGDIDIPRAFDILYQDKRWSGRPADMTSYLYPGCGFGGYCLPKDTQAAVHMASAVGGDAPLMRNALKVNETVKRFVSEKIASILPVSSTIGILGLSFKPGSDDVRGTPAVDIIRHLMAAGFGRIVAYDPMAMASFKKSYDLPIDYASSVESLTASSDGIVLLTAWPEFMEKRKTITQKRLFDFRYCLGDDR